MFFDNFHNFNISPTFCVNNVQKATALPFVTLLLPPVPLLQLINNTAKLNPNPAVISSLYMTFLKLLAV